MNLIKDIHFREISRPLRTVFSTSLGRKHCARSVIVRVGFDCGGQRESSFGEVPTSFAIRNETIPAIKRVLDKVVPDLVGTPVHEYPEKIRSLRKRFRTTPMTMSGLETALFRASLTCKGVCEHAFWGGRLQRLETDITIPFITEDDVLNKWLRFAAGKRFRTFKLKVSGNLADDSRLIGAVQRFLNDHTDRFVLRLDGNQGYRRNTFQRFIDAIEKHQYKIELIEQPLPKGDYDGLAYVRDRSPVPIILDETVFDTEDLAAAVRYGLGDGINIKFAKSGIAESADMIKMARKHRLKLMVGCMTETMVGLSAGIFCAAGTGDFDYIDLDSIHFLHHRNNFDPIKIDGPQLIIDPSPRTGKTIT
ncbi:MAG: hypothetical protein GXY33_05250 [Phycisphaerae bacterium]|nr:hypothetical protein [Phycisphaerae bacterium]